MVEISNYSCGDLFCIEAQKNPEIPHLNMIMKKNLALKMIGDLVYTSFDLAMSYCMLVPTVGPPVLQKIVGGRI